MKNKDGLWRLSPSGLHKYNECQSCFWVDNTYRKQPSLPWLLNSAMDSVLKHRFDNYRKTGEFPPEVSQELVAASLTPYADIDQLNQWRENSSALKVTNQAAGYELVGKIDDVLVDSLGRLVPADYKSSGNAPKEDKFRYYVDQLTAYGLMFRHHGYKVASSARLLHYFVTDKTNPSIEVSFSSHVDTVNIDLHSMEQKLAAMVTLLNGPYPGHNADCDNCGYQIGRTEHLNLA